MNPDEIHIRHCMLYEFHKGSTAAETAKNLCSVFGKDLIKTEKCELWFSKFSSGDYNLNDIVPGDIPVKFNSQNVRRLDKKSRAAKRKSPRLRKNTRQDYKLDDTDDNSCEGNVKESTEESDSAAALLCDCELENAVVKHEHRENIEEKIDLNDSKLFENFDKNTTVLSDCNDERQQIEGKGIEHNSEQLIKEIKQNITEQKKSKG